MKKYDQHKMMKGQARVNQLEAGFFDGRFVSRVEQPKTIYKRTVKHKNKGYVRVEATSSARGKSYLCITNPIWLRSA